MNDNIFQRISIPKPCHEDWNKLTPDEKGAFCKVCNKSVHDFSRKSSREVEEILLAEEDGKICGRFSTSQIQVPKDLEIPLHLLPRNVSPFRAFVLAVFLVFGTSLFGITDLYGQHMAGKVCVRRQEPDTTHKSQTLPSVKGDVKFVPEETKPPVSQVYVQGGARIAPIQPLNTQPEVVTVTHQEVTAKGEVRVEVSSLAEEPVPTLTGNICVIGPKPPQMQKPMDPITTVPPVTEPDTSAKAGTEINQGKEGEGKPSTVYILGDTLLTTSSEKAMEKVLTENYTLGWMSIAPLPKDCINDKGIYREETPGPGSLPSDSLLTTDLKATKEEPLVTRPDNPVNVTCFPNPNAGVVTIRYELTERLDVEANLFDLKGNFVRELFSIRNHYIGIYQNQVDLSELTNGIYLIRVRTGEQVSEKRIVISR